MLLEAVQTFFSLLSLDIYFGHLHYYFSLPFLFFIFFSRISCGFLRINNFRAFVARDVRKKRKKQYILVEFLSLRSFYSSQCGIPNISFQILIQIPFFCFLPLVFLGSIFKQILDSLNIWTLVL